MPAIKNLDSTSIVSPEVIGERIRTMREGNRMSLAKMEKLTGVSKKAILRLEHGEPTLPRTLKKVAQALGVSPEHFSVPESHWNKPYQHHRAEETKWNPATPGIPRRSSVPVAVDDVEERRRLASLGYFGSFFKPVCGQPFHANFGTLIAEAYSTEPSPPNQHGGLEFVYAFRGDIIVTVAGDDIYLKEGDAVTFHAMEPHTYRAANPVGRHDPAPQYLMVVMENLGGRQVKVTKRGSG